MKFASCLQNTLYELSLAEAGFKPHVEDVEPQQVVTLLL